MNHLAYIANIRLPTEKAHGYQICQMCHALAAQNTAVSLYHPRRNQTPALAGRQGSDALAYYGIPANFAIHTLPNLDIARLERWLPKRPYRAVFQLHAQRFGWRAARLARQNGATLFYTRDIPVADSLTRGNLPTVFEGHAIPEGRAAAMLAQVMKRPSFRHAVVLTQFIQQAYVALGASPAQINVEPDAVVLDAYTHLPDKTAVRQQLNLPLNRLIIGYIGRFETMGMDKGIGLLIEAISQLPRDLDPPPLLLCVGGPLDNVATYQQKAARLGVPAGWLQFHDRVPNSAVPRWIQAADVVTMPYPFTPHYAYAMSPMKLFEYMAAGKPIVSTDLPAIREILTHERNGLLVPVAETAVFATALHQLLTQPALAERLGQQARRDVTAYTWTARAARILQAVGHA